MLNFIQIWNNKNFDTLLHLVGFFFTNCLGICFTVLNLHVLRYSSAQHCSVQFVMPCFLGLQLVMYFALHSIINVPFHAVWILLGVKNVSIQCRNIMKFRVSFHDVQTQSVTQVNLEFLYVHFELIFDIKLVFCWNCLFN